MRKYKKGAGTLAVLAAVAFGAQAGMAAPDQSFNSAIQNATRGAFSVDRQARGRGERVLEMSTHAARQENKLLRMESRMQIDTARSIQALQNTQLAERATRRVMSVNLSQLPSDLNLRSRRDSYSISNLSGNVTISRAGQDLVVSDGSKLTAAELAAVYQVMQDGGQTLSLSKNGSADGGSLKLDAGAVNGLSSLYIPKNVTVTGDFTSAQQLNISGNLHNAGNLIVRADDPAVAAATISANHIRNSATGSIATLDTSTGSLDLNLISSTDIVNNGNISGNGNVSLSAVGSIINAAENGSGLNALISAGKNLSLQSAAIVNSGVLNATVGNINIADQLSAAIAPRLVSINGQGGTFSANNGDIVIGNNSFGAADGVLLSGGDYYSNKLIINAGAGSADGVVGDLTGELKVSAGAAHIGASTENLIIGQSVITGDPTFFNNAGNITIGGSIAFDEAIAILASGNISDSGLSTTIASRSVGDNGFNITLIAGATLKPLDGAMPTNSIPGGSITQGFVQVGKASATGGNVDLAASTIDSSGLNDGNAGNITIYALSDKAGNTGTVNVKEIFANGSGTGVGGTILVVGGADNSVAVTTTNVSTTAGGMVSLINTDASLKLTYNALGQETSSKVKLSTKSGTGGITSEAITTNGGNLTMQTAGLATIGAGGAVTSTVAAFPGMRSGDVFVLSGSTSVEGQVNASGQAGLSGTLLAPNGGVGGDGGRITIEARSGDISLSGPGALLSFGGNGGAGAAAVTSGTAGGDGGSGGFGGAITLVAEGGVSLASSSLLSTGGNGGSGGNGSDGVDAATGGIGGAGGAGGNGGGAGFLQVTANGGDIAALQFSATGGNGGSGGIGGNGGEGTTGDGGAGGAGGSAGNAGNGGGIMIANAGIGEISSVSITSSGGTAGNGGDGGVAGGSVSGFGGVGGAGGAGGAGGSSGGMTLQVESGNINITSIGLGGFEAKGTTGGNGGHGGLGGNTDNNGAAGAGGTGGAGGVGGDGADIFIFTSKKAGVLTGDATTFISTSGGDGGNGGDGANGGTNASTSSGGNGGDGGVAGSAGSNGNIEITAANVALNGTLRTYFTNGTSNGGAGGNGGASLTGAAGAGGNGGAGGAASVGGNITITGSSVQVAYLQASAGAAGFGGAGGSGGSLIATGIAGDGGTGGVGGNGANAGTLTVKSASLNSAQLFVNGSDGGNGGRGGDGGSAVGAGFAGAGGMGGGSGSQGSGGFVFVSTKSKTNPDINISTIQANAGFGSANSGDGGDGGSADSQTGGDGGNGGTVGALGSGGFIQLHSGANVNLNSVTANGGTASTGDGGSAGTANAGGGQGGNGGVGSAGGGGGLISVSAKKGNINVTGLVTLAGGKGANGGFGGFGGLGATGGTAGDGGAGGAGGIGGEGTFVSKKGVVTLQDVTVAGGAGGAGGIGGIGGFSNNGTAGAGGAGVGGGVGGRGGNLSFTAATLIGNNIQANGGAGGAGGIGGLGGSTNAGTGAQGSTGGNGGAAGIGGTVTATKLKGDVTFQTVSAEGGAGGAGGAGGSGGGAITGTNGAGNDAGNGALGGTGGTINLSTKGTLSVAVGTSADGGAGGSGGTGGSGGNSLGAGGDGGNGANGGSGGVVKTSTALTPPATADGGAAGGSGSGGLIGGGPGTAGTAGNNGTVTP